MQEAYLVSVAECKSRIFDCINSARYLRKSPLYGLSVTGVTDRCKFFYHLHCFLYQWEPLAFTKDARKVRVARRSTVTGELTRRRASLPGSEEFDTIIVEQSLLAHECPRFPDELFGGKDSPSCQKIRTMFGYACGK